MRYFKAVEIKQKPFIFWNGIANDIAELAELELFEDPLILAEDSIPKLIYGVCPLKIVGGELVNRTSLEMSDFQYEYELQQNLNEQYSLIKGINNGTFTYDSQIFPMDERSRILYNAISNIVFSPDEAINLMASDGKQYNLFEVDKAGFLEAYYWRLYQLSKPNFPV